MAHGRGRWIPYFLNLLIETAMPAITPPKSSKSTHATFDGAAIERLQKLLHDRMDHSDSMPMEGIDGLFCSAWLAPGADVSLDEVMPVALDGMTTPVSDEVHDLMTAFWAFVGKRLVRTPDGDITDLLPLIAFPLAPGVEPDEKGAAPIPESFPIGAAWAAGFLVGCSLRQDAWEQRINRNEALQWQFIDIVDLAHVEGDDWDLSLDDDDVDPSPIEPLFDGTLTPALEPSELADNTENSAQDEFDEEDLWDEEDDGVPEPMSLDDRLELIADLPAFLYELHLISIDERSVHTPVRRAAGPGRNDACPCGSGLKFKHCHGDPGRRH